MNKELSQGDEVLINGKDIGVVSEVPGGTYHSKYDPFFEVYVYKTRVNCSFRKSSLKLYVLDNKENIEDLFNE